METRFQHLFLSALQRSGLGLIIGLLAVPVSAQRIDTEFFELGLTTGVLNIEDFGSELSWGFNTTFKASEDFFLQFNYLRTDVGLSSVEQSPQGAFTGNRTFQHLNLLLGYNLLQGEIFRGDYTGLSSLYLLGGFGDTEFLDEANFTYIAGIGYQMALSRRYTIHFDYHTLVYDSVVIDQQSNRIANTHLAVSLKWLF